MTMWGKTPVELGKLYAQRIREPSAWPFFAALVAINAFAVGVLVGIQF